MANTGDQAPLAIVMVVDTSFDPPRKYGIAVRAGKTLSFGRDGSNDYVLDDFVVSRHHFEIYSIEFDDTSRHQPLIYVRDLRSINGTFVNHELVGIGPRITPARVLENDDQINIRPYWTFSLCQNFEGPNLGLRPVQRDEVSLFEDEYVVQDRTIGEGAFGMVHLALDVKSNRQLVCKVHDLVALRQKHRLSDRRVNQEVAILSQLDHVNILSFTRAFRSLDTLYIFTELGTGGDLFSLLGREQVLNELDIRWIMRQVLHGLTYLHEKGIVHRDIKPENIICMIGPGSQVGRRIAISDFGCAAVASRGRMTSTVGTFLYRAPECQMPDQPYDAAVDIWAAGVLAIQLFAGDSGCMSPEELCDLSNLNSLLEKADVSRREYGDHPVSTLAFEFIYSCLQPVSRDRPAAAQAAKLEWLNEPSRDRRLFEREEREMARSWRHRQIVFPMIQDIQRPDEVLDTKAQVQVMDAAVLDGETRHIPTESVHFGQQKKKGPASTSIVPRKRPQPTRSSQEEWKSGPASIDGRSLPLGRPKNGDTTMASSSARADGQVRRSNQALKRSKL